MTRDRGGKAVKPNWIVEAWANVNQPNSSNACHYHPGSFWSASYYVDDGGCLDHPEYGGEFEMMDPRGPAPMMHAPMLKFAGEDGLSAGSAETIKPRPGLLFIFPVVPAARRCVPTAAIRCAFRSPSISASMRPTPLKRLERAMSGHILVIDQGTTSTRSIVFDERAQAVASAQSRDSRRSIRIPAGSSTIRKTSGARRCRPRARRSAKVGGPRIDRRDRHHQPARDDAGLGPQDRQADLQCDRLAGSAHGRHMRRSSIARGHADLVGERAGLVLDPYFSATKIAWILDHVEGARARAARGELAFGTVDTFLLWRLTGGAVHATDATNASRTSLLNLRSGAWDDTLIDLFNAPRSAAAGGARHRRLVRRDAERALRRRAADLCDGRRSAIGAGRTGLPRARHGEGDLRHRRVHPAQHRR